MSLLISINAQTALGCQTPTTDASGSPRDASARALWTLALLLYQPHFTTDHQPFPPPALPLPPLARLISALPLKAQPGSQRD